MALKPAVSTARPVEEDTEVPASITRHAGNGRPKIRHADDPTQMSYWPRASSFAERVEETYTLDRHNERLVVRGMSISPDLCDLAQVLAGAEERADKDELTRIAGLAKTAAGGDRKSNSGTALHKLRERYDRGEDLAFVGPKLWDALQAYIALMEHIAIHASEQFVVNDRWCTAGSYDILGSPAPGFEMIAPDGEIFTEHDRTIMDLKSGAHIDELGRVERAVQQVIYAYGTPYVHVSDQEAAGFAAEPDGTFPPDNGRRDWPDGIAPSRTWSLIPHVPLESPEDAAWWWVDLTKAAMIADEVAHLHELRKIEGLIVPAEPPRPVAEPAPPRERIEVAEPAPRNEQWRTCSDCNYDTHICQGCGEPVTHEQGRSCAACDAEREAEQVAEREAEQAAEREAEQAAEREAEQAAEREAEQAAEREAEQTAPALAEKPLTWGGLELERPVMPGVIEHLALLEAIQAAGSEDEIDDIWESHRDAWTDAHTAAVRTRLAQLSHGSTEVRTS